MTLDKLATMTQREFLAVRKDMATKDDLKNFATKDDLKNFATKDDLRSLRNDVVEHFATKEDLKGLKHELKQDIQAGTVEVLRAVDKIMVRFDKAEKDHAADKLLHDRHEKRLERIEARLVMR